MTRLARVATVLCVVALIVLSWLPKSMEHRTGAPGYLEHVVAYLVTAVFMKLGWPMNRTRWMGLGLGVLGGLLEVGQLLVPGRTAQVIDFGASVAGGFVGLLVAHMFLHRSFRRF